MNAKKKALLMSFILRVPNSHSLQCFLLLRLPQDIAHLLDAFLRNDHAGACL